MKRNILKIAAVITATVGLGASVQADPITGTTGFTGYFSAANNNLTTANDLVTISTAALNGIPTGSFVGGVLTGFTPSITLNGPGGNPVIASEPLWTLKVGTHTYEFDATSSTTLLDSKNINIIEGAGTVTDMSDGDTAPGTYNLSFNVTGAGTGTTLTWNGTTGAEAPPTVPDGGTTVMLLGSALAGLGLIRRKLA